jgi:hypothetical protein
VARAETPRGGGVTQHSDAVIRFARAVLVATTCAPATLVAQYPIAPSPPLDVARLGATLRIGGYGAVRATRRSDTTTFSVVRGRVTADAQPVAFAAVRVQADLAATGRTTGDTVPPFVLTDAFVQLSPPESSVVYRRFRPALLVGQFKAPFSLEYLTPFSLLRMVNRSQVVDSVSVRREIGVMAEVRAWDRIILAGAVLNGEGANRPTNANGVEMFVGRVTLLAPVGGLVAVAGKLLSHAGDHRWGADVRWVSSPRRLPGRVIVEGEMIRRSGSARVGTDADASGGYALVAWRVARWIEPVVKWERLRDRRVTASAATERRGTWTAWGVNLQSPDPAERFRLLLNWVMKTERPVDARNELVLQLLVQF